MITTEPTMTHLFLPLGLQEGAQAIAEFIQVHPLPAGVALADAPYWNAAQRQFLAEQLTADAPWALVVDQLSEALHAAALERGVPQG